MPACCLLTKTLCDAGLEQLPNFRKFNFKGSARSVLRQKLPAPGPVFDGRPTLSEAGFDLLRGMLELCPVSALHVCLPRVCVVPTPQAADTLGARHA